MITFVVAHQSYDARMFFSVSYIPLSYIFLLLIAITCLPAVMGRGVEIDAIPELLEILDIGHSR